MITLARPKRLETQAGDLLVSPSACPKAGILQKVTDVFANLVSNKLGRQAPCPIPLERPGVWHEWHAADESGQSHQHDHVVVFASTSFRHMPIKRALFNRHGLPSHWSVHQGSWSVVRYLASPSPTKPSSSLDPRPSLWDQLGPAWHPPSARRLYLRTRDG